MPRAWYSTGESDYLIQVQKDRFLLNWRSIQNTDSQYPYFESFFEKFKKEWGKFESYISEKSGNISLRHYELTYVNHLIKGKHWKYVSDLKRYFKYLNFLDMFPKTNKLNLDINYLHKSFSIKSSIKEAVQNSEDNKEIFILNFSIFEKINLENSFEDRMKKANEMLNEHFVSLTTDQAHEKWGRSDS